MFSTRLRLETPEALSTCLVYDVNGDCARKLMYSEVDAERKLRVAADRPRSTQENCFRRDPQRRDTCVRRLTFNHFPISNNR